MAEAKILASIAGTNITEADVDALVASLSQRGQNYNTPEGRNMVLEQLIHQKLFLIDASRNLYEREPAFKAELARLKEDLLINYAVNKAVEGVRVTEEETKKYFDEHKEMTEEEKKQYLAEHKEVTPEELQMVKKNFEWVAERIEVSLSLSSVFFSKKIVLQKETKMRGCSAFLFFQ